MWSGRAQGARDTMPSGGQPRGPQPLKGPRGPLKGPQDPGVISKGPRGPLEGPRGPLKGSRVPFKGPRVPLKGPRDPLKGPRVLLKDPGGARDRMPSGGQPRGPPPFGRLSGASGAAQIAGLVKDPGVL